ncbi:FAD-dependent oxidoreductase [Nocardiopsis alba]|uniref:FAD-dependent oxidoreductase n=1 Tax=Nocardiopsis alba TaxID=53437 RepID=UPI003D737C0A
MDITVVGGGLAGLTAAIAGAENGANVTVLESHRTLGGRARSTEPPYVANDGPHALYTDGAPYRWLAERDLVPPLVRPSLGSLRSSRFRYRERLTGRPPRALLRALARRGLSAPVERDFTSWGTERLGEESTRLVASMMGVALFEADPGRLSAAFVWERFRRLTRPQVPAVRYPVGGWVRLVERMADHARAMGVRIETGHRVDSLPEGPVVVATSLAAARSLLDDPSLAWESGHSLMTDLGLRSADDPFLVSDLDEGGFLERYSAHDRFLAPEGEELVQAQIPVRAGESRAEATERLERLLDTALGDWRERLTWRRDQMARGRTGALDLPSSSWRDRPAIDRGGDVYLAGDEVAAPGLLGEVSFTSAVRAANLATSRAPAPLG